MATTTAAPVTSPPSVYSVVWPIPRTGVLSRTVPSGSPAAISSGSRDTPSDGTDGVPSRNERSSRAAKLAEVD